MKKIISTIILLIVLCGCTNNNSETLVLNNTNSEVFGELNIDRKLNNLNFKFSSYWQFMDSNVYDDDVEMFDGWHVAYITDYNLQLICGYAIDETKTVTKHEDINDCFEELKTSLKDGGFAYSYVDTITISNRNGFLFDVAKDNCSYRLFYLSDDGCCYIFALTNGDNLIPSIGLDFMYDYVQTFTIDSEGFSKN